MEIPQFITELLYRQRRVTIPGLGTLSAGHESGQGGLFPFMKGLNFSESYDKDGKELTERISEQRQITPSAAGYEIDKFVIRVKQELSRKGSFQLASLGILKLGAGGKILFESLLNDQALFGLQPVPAQVMDQENVVDAMSRKIGLKNVHKNKFRLLWLILLGLIVLALVFLLLVRLNVLGNIIDVNKF